MSRMASGWLRLRLLKPKKAAVAIGLAVVMLFVATVAFGLNATHGLPLAPRKIVKAAFSNVNGLTEGDDVRIASARVGYVEDIRVEHGEATAVLKLDDENMKIYRNATTSLATVGARSALGQKFVDLNPGSPEAGELATGEVVSARATRSAEDISQLWNVFDPPTREATGRVIRELGGGVDGHSRDVNDLLQQAPTMLPDLGTVSRSLAVDRGANLTGTLQAADRLSSRFQGRQQQIAGLTRQLGTTLDAVAVEGGKPVQDSLKHAPSTLRETKGALNALAPPLHDTEQAASALRPGAKALGQATPDVRGVLREGVQPLNKVPGVAEKAKPAVTELTGVMADARPLSARLVKTVDRAATPLAVLAPYSKEISSYFTAGASALSQGDSAGHWLRIMVVPRGESASGALPVQDPTVWRNAYPQPGQAETDSAPSPVNGGQG